MSDQLCWTAIVTMKTVEVIGCVLYCTSHCMWTLLSVFDMNMLQHVRASIKSNQHPRKASKLSRDHFRSVTVHTELSGRPSHNPAKHNTR